MAATPDPTLAGYIARLKVAVILAETWAKGDVTTDVAGTDGVYPSLAKLTKNAQDQINALMTNPAMLGTGGFTPPKGTTAQREASPAKGRTRYNTFLDTLESFTPSGWLSLENVIIAAYRGNVSQSSGTTKIPFDATPPLITEGTQLWTKQVTPQVIGALMSIDFSTMVNVSADSNVVTMSLFRDNTLIGVCSTSTTNKSNPSLLRVAVNDPVTSLTPVTYSCRIGCSNGTWYQGRGVTETLGGAVTNGWKIDEVLV